VNGEEVKFPDAQPFIDANGRTQTPARFIGEALGATVTWDGNAKKAVFEKSETTLVLFIGKREYEVNGQKKQMDTEALLIEGRTFVRLVMWRKHLVRQLVGMLRLRRCI